MLFSKTIRKLPPKHHRFQQVQISYIISRDLIIQFAEMQTECPTTIGHPPQTSSAKKLGSAFLHQQQQCLLPPLALT